jgi:S1-C subfamily serine protease
MRIISEKCWAAVRGTPARDGLCYEALLTAATPGTAASTAINRMVSMLQTLQRLKIRFLIMCGVLAMAALVLVPRGVQAMESHSDRPESAAERVYRQCHESVVSIKAIIIVKTVRRVHTTVYRPILQPNGRILTRKTDRVVTHTTTVTTTSVASGVIIDRRGYIVTNAHVVFHAKSIEVMLADRRSYPASLVGYDQRADLAVIRIHAPNIQPAIFGNSSLLRVGERVLDIGAPFRFAGSLTQGIISALHRHDISVNGDTDPHLNMIRHEDYIQTDAPTDPGSSGGALLNLRGHVIGINDSIKSGGAGSFSGVGFVIPANAVRYAAAQIIKYGRVHHGHAGLTVKTASVIVKLKHGISLKRGVLVEGVKANSPGAAAGLKKGDLILAINGRRIMHSAQLQNRIMFSAPGTPIQLRVWSSGTIRNVILTPVARLSAKLPPKH